MLVSDSTFGSVRPFLFNLLARSSACSTMRETVHESLTLTTLVQSRRLRLLFNFQRIPEWTSEGSFYLPRFQGQMSYERHGSTEGFALPALRRSRRVPSAISCLSLFARSHVSAGKGWNWNLITRGAKCIPADASRACRNQSAAD